MGTKKVKPNERITRIALDVSCRCSQLKENNTLYSVAQILSHSVGYMLHDTDIRQPVCHQEAHNDCA